MSFEKAEDMPTLASVADKVRFHWTLGEIAETIGVSARELRRAFSIIETKEMSADIFLKSGGKRTIVFQKGFNHYIKKGAKKDRKISQPHPDVQKVFEAIKDWLYAEFSSHKNAFGFVRGRNIRMAVEALQEGKHFVAMDIADAFPSITMTDIKSMLEKLGVDADIAQSLAWLTTYHHQGQRRLPQGASASPILQNLVYKPMCEEIDRVCAKNRIEWMVYADDFNFAGKNIQPEAKEELLSIPERFGFKIKPKKIKDNSGRTIPHMLGMTIVDGKVHICRKRKKEYRRIMHEALCQGTHSPEKMRGIANAISSVYGGEENWPGWLLQPWEKYQESVRRLV